MEQGSCFPKGISFLLPCSVLEEVGRQSVCVCVCVCERERERERERDGERDQDQSEAVRGNLDSIPMFLWTQNLVFVFFSVQGSEIVFSLRGYSVRKYGLGCGIFIFPFRVNILCANTLVHRNIWITRVSVCLNDRVRTFLKGWECICVCVRLQGVCEPHPPFLL
jgi:hypothetical protein